MSSLFTMKKIVKAPSQAEAAELFHHRHELGLCGVIFKPEIELPKWTAKEKAILGEYTYWLRPFTRSPAGVVWPTAEWLRVAGNSIPQLMNLSEQFNQTQHMRGIRFVNDDVLAEAPHRDLNAVNGWTHVHVEGGAGAGMGCANPVGDEPVQLRFADRDGEKINQEDFGRLVVIERRIEILTLEELEAIVFDENMIHLSGFGPRSRILTYG